MSCNISNSSFTTSLLPNNVKAQVLESTLQQSMVYFKEFLIDFEQLHIDMENFKKQFHMQREKCESKTCSSSDALKKIIDSKNNIIGMLASTLTTLYETKNLNLVNDAFKIICGDVDVPQPEVLKTSPKSQNTIEPLSTNSLNDETVNEIAGTPTGRISPIIPSKKVKNNTGKSSDFRDKKKCPDSWLTPEKKVIKLTYPTPTGAKPGGRMKQARLNLVKLKQTNIVDLTCSPEFSGGSRNIKSENESPIQVQIKKELEDDDTILPSPTSGSINFSLLKTTMKASPVKFKKPQLSLKPKNENLSKLQFEKVENKTREDVENMDHSVNILQHLHTRTPKKDIHIKEQQMSEDTTYCDTNMSISVLGNLNNVNEVHNSDCSPPKCPLGENKNILNTPPKENRGSNNKTSAVENAKRCLPDLSQTLYKEPTVRKKSEKQALPGWCCEDCKNFYGALYKDDPVMMAIKIEECSKHRGRNNPARPKTPPNFWNPRWSVPEDTEELNRMNNS